MKEVRAISRAGLLLAAVLIVAWWSRVPAELARDHADRITDLSRATPWFRAADRLRAGADAVAIGLLPLGALIVAWGAVKIARPNRRLLWATVLLLWGAAIAIGLLAADAATFEPLVLTPLGSGTAWYHTWIAIGAIVVVISSFAIAFAALAIKIVTLGTRLITAEPEITRAEPEITRAEPENSPRPLWFGAGAALLAMLLGGHWLLGTHSDWASRPPGRGYIEALLSYMAVYSGLSFLTAVLYTLQIPLFLAILLALRASAAKPPSLSFGTASPWVAPLIALVFAAFVVGRGGWIDPLALPLPIAFVAALIALTWFAHHPASEQGEVDVGTDPVNGWWENGLIAMRLGLPLALVPFLFYLYVLLNTRLGPSFALDSGPDLPFLYDLDRQ